MAKMSLKEMESYAQVLADSGFVSAGGTRGGKLNIPQIMTLMIMGESMGLNPIQAVFQLNIIYGKPELSAAVMANIIKSTGKYYWTSEYETEKDAVVACHMRCYERVEGEEPTFLGISSFSMEDAKRAGLTSNKLYKTYPRNLLFARALSNAAKWYFPDAFGGGVYVEGELSQEEETSKSNNTNSGTKATPFDRKTAVKWAMSKGAFASEADAVAALKEITKNNISEDAKRNKWMLLVKERLTMPEEDVDTVQIEE